MKKFSKEINNKNQDNNKRFQFIKPNKDKFNIDEILSKNIDIHIYDYDLSNIKELLKTCKDGCKFDKLSAKKVIHS